MPSVVSISPVSPFLPASGAGLQVVRFSPGQGVAALRGLRRRLYDEQGDLAALEDDALEMSATTAAVVHYSDVVAAMRIHAADTSQLGRDQGALLHLEHFASSWSAESVVIGSRLSVLADYRVRPVVDLLMREAYMLARDSGVRFALISCAPQLQALFSFYGFREYLPPAILPGGTAVLRMVLVCEHATTLRASGSPLLDLVQQPQLGDAAHTWLAQAFPMLG